MRRYPHLLHLLAAGLVVLAGACGEVPSASGPLEVRIVDEHGRPAGWARVLLRRSEGAAGRVRPRWDEGQAVLTLPREGAPHALHVAARGRRTQVVEGVRDDLTVRLQLGYPIEIHVTGDVQAPELPRLILYRIRPVTEGDPATDEDAALRVSDVCAFILPRHGGEEGSLPLLPTHRWGFAASATDAAAGLLLPEPGPYAVQWGLFDTDEGTWQAAPGPARILEVTDQGRTAQRLEIAIDEDLMQSVRRALRAQVDAIHEAERARGEGGGPEAPPDAPEEPPATDGP